MKCSDFDDLRRDYQDAVECLGYCESIINSLQEKLSRREEHIVGLEELVEMSLELQGERGATPTTGEKEVAQEPSNIPDNNGSEAAGSEHAARARISAMMASVVTDYVEIEETEVAQLHTELQRRELIAKLQAELKRRELPAELQRRRELGEDKYAATTDVADKKVPKKTCLTKKASKTMPGAPPRPYTTYNIFFQLEREYILQHGKLRD